LWINNGGPAALSPVAAAIAMAESGGCSSDLNPDDNNGTQTSWGLWQISNGTHAPPSPNILDPNVNARAAVAKWKDAGGFSPWGTFDSGAYRAFLGGGTPDFTGLGAGADATLASARGANPATCIAGFGGGNVTLPVVGQLFSVPCLLSKTEARAIIGAMAITSGGFVVLVGTVLLAAYGLRSAGAGRAAGVLLENAGAAAAIVPGGERAGLAVSRAGRNARAAGVTSAARTAATSTAQRRLSERRRAELARQAAARRAARNTPRKPPANKAPGKRSGP